MIEYKKEITHKDLDLPRFSASKIQRYSNCKADYISRYLLGMKPSMETTWGIFGTVCHSAIQAGYEDTAFPYDVVNRVVTAKFAELEGKPYVGYSPSRIVEKAYAVLDAFDYDQFSPAVMEREFILPFAVDGVPICEIHGFIDMITTDNRVIDFKTNSKAPTYKEVANSIQLSLYAWAVYVMSGEWPDEVAIFHLPTNRYIKADLDSLKRRLDDITRLIQEMLELTPDTAIQACSNCNPFCSLKNWGQDT